MTSEFSIAVHALVYLNHKSKCLPSEDLSKNICTNPARVRKIMAKLKKSGLIATKEGADGGYIMLGDPGTTTLAQISEAMDTTFVSATWRSGSADMNCLVSSGMADIMDGIYCQLDALCREHLKKITVQMIDEKIFGNGTPGNKR